MSDDESDVGLVRAIGGRLRFRRRHDYLKPVIATLLATMITAGVNAAVSNINDAAKDAYWRAYEHHVEDQQRYDPCSGGVLREHMH